ncbi:flagellar basal body-associated FliL family protein [Palleronia sp. LCG004]|uniref:flagellar basal body-associated FliL family protein n=1 Tax=Palleronia sp. LCG004 TaxID=3079304 RepID=UPI002942EF68|nr:flagellar basal body-associated FliL family protein [Palleronia sp. LCG004]WOI56187.1 flagellar basal body-associated FliL family protein [Palleronia sp. LCG004]
MIAKLLPIVLVLVGLGAGVGAGVALRPEADPESGHDAELAAGEGGPCGIDPNAVDDHGAGAAPAKKSTMPAADSEFVRLADQFVVPVIEGDKVKSLVVMTLSVETAPGLQDAILARTPKLRDGFLRVMLDHANIGGFDGSFTSNGSMETLRRGFLETARQQFPEGIRDVLVLEINRQDIA